MTEIETRLAEIEAHERIYACPDETKLALVKALRMALTELEICQEHMLEHNLTVLTKEMNATYADIADILRQDQPPSMRGATGGLEIPPGGFYAE